MKNWRQFVKLTVLRMSRPLFVGSYLQVTWWVLGQWKARKNASNDNTGYSPGFSLGKFSHVTRLDQSRASEIIRWTIRGIISLTLNSLLPYYWYNQYGFCQVWLRPVSSKHLHRLPHQQEDNEHQSFNCDEWFRETLWCKTVVHFVVCYFTDTNLGDYLKMQNNAMSVINYMYIRLGQLGLTHFCASELQLQHSLSGMRMRLKQSKRTKTLLKCHMTGIMTMHWTHSDPGGTPYKKERGGACRKFWKETLRGTKILFCGRGLIIFSTP